MTALPVVLADFPPTKFAIRRRFSSFPPFNFLNSAAAPVLPAAHFGGNFALYVNYSDRQSCPHSGLSFPVTGNWRLVTSKQKGHS